jgi:hypothetical protein
VGGTQHDLTLSFNVRRIPSASRPPHFGHREGAGLSPRPLREDPCYC